MIRKPFDSRGVVLPAVFALLTGCDGGGCDECDECQKSVDHLVEKIEMFGCNPTPQDSARERIHEDCTNDAEWLIGAAVEECRSQEGISLRAPCNGGRLTKGAVDFLVDPAAQIYPEGVRFAVSVDGFRGNSITETANNRPVEGGEFRLEHGEADRLVIEFGSMSELRIELIDQVSGEVIAEDAAFFEVDETTDSWLNYQYRQVVASDGDGIPFVEFVNF